jgi:hypothetical protein
VKSPLVFAVLAGLLAGCALGPHASNPTDAANLFTIISTEPASLTGYDLERARITYDVEVTVATHTILWIPTRVPPPTLEEAVAEMLYRGGGDVIVNAEVQRFGWYLPPFYGQEGWRIRGDVVNSKRLRDSTPVQTSQPGGVPDPDYGAGPR